MKTLLEIFSEEIKNDIDIITKIIDNKKNTMKYSVVITGEIERVIIFSNDVQVEIIKTWKGDMGSCFECIALRMYCKTIKQLCISIQNRFF